MKKQFLLPLLLLTFACIYTNKTSDYCNAQEKIKEDIAAFIQDLHAKERIPGDVNFSTIDVKVNHIKNNKKHEYICNVYLHKEEGLLFLLQGIYKLSDAYVKNFINNQNKTRPPHKAGSLRWKKNIFTSLRKTRINYLKTFERKIIKNIETIMRNDITSGKTGFNPTKKFSLEIKPEYTEKDIATLYNPEQPIIRATANKYLIEIFNKDGSSAGLARMTLEENEIRDFLERFDIKTIHLPLRSRT